GEPAAGRPASAVAGPRPARRGARHPPGDPPRVPPEVLGPAGRLRRALDAGGADLRGGAVRGRAAGRAPADRPGPRPDPPAGGGGEPSLTVLVPGAAGFLGRHVAAALLARGHRVRVLVRPATSIDGLPWAGRVEVSRADLRSPRGLDGAFEGIDVLVHLAAR